MVKTRYKKIWKNMKKALTNHQADDILMKLSERQRENMDLKIKSFQKNEKVVDKQKRQC